MVSLRSSAAKEEPVKDEFDDEFADDFPELSQGDLDMIDGKKDPIMIEAEQHLSEVFGYPHFRLLQEQVVERLLVKRKSALVLFPTGGGKSLCFQIPALCLPGLTVVVSPLISLMKDQVDVLRKKGVAAAQLDSSLSLDESLAVKRGIREGTLKILYCAPERLNNEGFTDMIKDARVSMLAVDESHCVSEWGASFRPEYLKVARFAVDVNAEVVVCLTATATDQVARAICESFNIDPEYGIFKTPVFRSNLRLNVLSATNLEDKVRQIVPALKARTGPAILYVATQKQTEQLAEMLQQRHGIVATSYHGGMDAERRKVIQNQFMASEKDIVCATIAFAMGIDKANIRIIAHINFAKSLEAYSQEVGRAGRDGLPSDCYLFLCNDDLSICEGFIRGDTCSKSVILAWLTHFCSLRPTDVSDPGVIAVSPYQQSNDFDIRSTQLGIYHAQLELDFGLIKTLTPAYTSFGLKPLTTAGWNQVMSDSTRAGLAVLGALKKGTTWNNVDVYETAASSGIPRAELQKTINRWEIKGWCEMKASGVKARYLLLGDGLPSTPQEIDALAGKLFDIGITREERDIARLKKVVEVSTGASCIAKSLSDYFSSEFDGKNGKCGACTFCRTGVPGAFPPSHRHGATIQQNKINAILELIKSRDDPRFLARFAFGIASPRLKAEGLNAKDPLLGSMDDCPFEDLLAIFTTACQGHATIRGPPAPKAATGSGSSRGKAASTCSRGGAGSSRGASSRGASSRGASSRGKPYGRG